MKFTQLYYIKCVNQKPHTVISFTKDATTGLWHCLEWSPQILCSPGFFFLILNLFNTHQSENIHWHYVGSPKNRSYHSVFFVLLVLEGNCSIRQISEYSFSSILLWLPVVWIVGIRDFFPGAVTAALQVAVAALPWDHLPDAYLDGHCWTMQISWSSSNYTDSCRSRI